MRFATAQLRAGHLPLTSWFPFLGEGSPQFLHYQSLPAILTGLVGLAVGPDAAFRWSLYLLLSLWPISVYLSARAFGAGRPAAAASAAMAPFLVSATGVGYEQHAYVWTGFGVWTQLWASWTLPLAWGLSWRAIRDGRGYCQSGRADRAHRRTALRDRLPGALGAARLAARRRQAARHPLAASCGPSRRFAARGGVGDRPARAAAPVGGRQRAAAGHRARQRLRRASSARLAGLGPAARPRPAARRDRARGARAWTWRGWPGLSTPTPVPCWWRSPCALLFAFGRTTFGSLVDVVPGSADLFFRRFMMGVQLAALLLAGRGAAWLAAGCVRLLEARAPRWPPGLSAAAVLVAAVAVLAPAWLQLGAYDRHDERGDRGPAQARTPPRAPSSIGLSR